MTPHPDILSSDVLIIGGGSSGMMAAITASRKGASIRILERMDRIGKKLLVTGNGRCNLTNLTLNPKHYHGAEKEFIAEVLNRFGLKETLSFFEGIGLAWKADDDHRVYPQSGQASAVLDLLRFELERCHVQIECSARAESLVFHDGHFIVTLKNHRRFSTDKVILAAGGMAMKDLGSNGSGYKLAEQQRHSIILPFPALVKIRLDSPILRGIKGVRTDGHVSLISDNQEIHSCAGELMFADDGLSGIPALQLSRHVHSSQSSKTLSIDLMPDISQQALDVLLMERFHRMGHLSMEQALTSLLNKRLILPLLKTAGIDHTLPCGNVNRDQITALTKCIKQWTFPVLGTRAWNEAQVTAGGINTREIDAETMQSRICHGLYFSGEIMDVDGDCGGYNLQWAWSTGHIAGTSAANSLNEK